MANDKKNNVEFSVLSNIIDYIPATKLDTSNLKLTNHIELADTNFHIPALIDNEFVLYFKSEQIGLADGKCILQNTELWVFRTGSLQQFN